MLNLSEVIKYTTETHKFNKWNTRSFEMTLFLYSSQFSTVLGGRQLKSEITVQKLNNECKIKKNIADVTKPERLTKKSTFIGPSLMCDTES